MLQEIKEKLSAHLSMGLSIQQYLIHRKKSIFAFNSSKNQRPLSSLDLLTLHKISGTPDSKSVCIFIDNIVLS